MTLVISVLSRHSVWMASDRRLSAPGQEPKDSGTKLVRLETLDAVALCGYSGLGCTALGNQPSQWLSNVVRGQDLPLVPTLQVIREAMARQFPPHLKNAPPAYRRHQFIVAAFLNGKPECFLIELWQSGTEWKNRCVRLIQDGGVIGMKIAPSLVAGGSGISTLMTKIGKAPTVWQRELRRVVKAQNRKGIGPQIVCRQFADLIEQVSIHNATVSDDCIVAWHGVRGGGGQRYFNCPNEKGVRGIPTILRGLDGIAIAKALMPELMELQKGRPPSVGVKQPLDVPITPDETFD